MSVGEYVIPVWLVVLGAAASLVMAIFIVGAMWAISSIYWGRILYGIKHFNPILWSGFLIVVLLYHANKTSVFASLLLAMSAILTATSMAAFFYYDESVEIVNAWVDHRKDRVALRSHSTVRRMHARHMNSETGRKLFYAGLVVIVAAAGENRSRKKSCDGSRQAVSSEDA